jgi:O-succinylbenzoic acid--CoA ligase
MSEPLLDPGIPWLLERARRDPHALAIDVNGERISFADLAFRSEAIARRLRTLAVEPGDRVAVLLGSSVRFVELLHASQRLGAALVPFNTRLTASEVRALVEDCRPRLLAFDAPAAAVASEVARLHPKIGVVESTAGIDRVAPSSDLPEPRLDPHSVFTIVYTSGTTGAAKGAMLTHANHFASASASRANLSLRLGDRWLAVLPLHHVGGLSILLRSVIDGTAVVLHPAFDAGSVERAIHEQGITLLSLVTTTLRRLLDHSAGRRYPRSLRAALIGGGATPAALLEQARAHGIPALATYGLTEAASQVTTESLEEDIGSMGSAGRPLPGTRVAIDGPDANGDGEILVAGPTVMAGYFGRREETERALRGGWLHTGDVGRLDAGGHLYVHDRRSDLIVSGGENVYPAEIEAVLLAHPGVSEAAVYPVADPDWGHHVGAAIVLRGGRRLAAEELREWCAGRLARFKLPRTIRFVDSLPRTASGKVKRREAGRLGAGEDATSERPPLSERPPKG